ncbi:MAG: hypothetical protein ACR2NN_01940 [Bryobacteraceae bacterium]
MQAQTPAPAPAGQPADASGKQRNFKDRAEYDLYEAARTATDPNVALQKLNEWKEKYKDTDYEKDRRAFYLNAYVKLGQTQKAIDAAKDLLALDPGDFIGAYYITLLTPQLGASGQTLTPDQLDQADKAANSILNGGLDKQFAPDKKPAGTTDEAWKTARTGTEAAAHTTLGYDAMTAKKNEEAETQFKQAIATNPNDGNVAYWLGTVILLEKKPEKQSEGLYYLARAAVYDGPGALNPAGRKQVQDYVAKNYKSYHGSNDGMDQLMQQAKASATPPPGFKITTAVDIEKDKLAKEQEMEKQNPQLALWKSIKAQLTAADGATYFNSSMKDALLPTLSGKVVKLEPETRPKTVVLALEDGTTPDATLKFDPALAGKAEPGTVLSFEGIPESYTASPFMVNFKVDKDKLHGWTGKGEAPARKPPVRRRPVRR